MIVRLKKLHPDAVIPTYAKPGDAGMDFTATSKSYDEHGNIVYGTGLAIEIPRGYVGLLFPRSSISKKQLIMINVFDDKLILTNTIGVLDSGYRGEILFKFKKTEPSKLGEDEYNIGDRVGQIIIIPYPQIQFIEASELSTSERGTGGYGSTGK